MIVVKTIWALMPSTQNVVPVWDSKFTPSFTPHSDKGAPLDPPQFWATTSPVNVSDTESCMFTPPPTKQAWKSRPPSVSLGCYYWKLVQKAELDVATQQAQTNIAHATGTSRGPFHLVLLGFHVAAQGPQGWTWQTFWWSGRVLDAEHDKQAGNPFLTDATPYPWSRYVMNTSPPRDTAQTVENPYLEAQLPSGLTSNCIRCHSLARFHLTQKNPDGTQQQDCYFKVGVAEGTNQKVTPCGPEIGLGTDLLWSLADPNVTSIHGGDSADLLFKDLSPIKSAY
jgi:hypothetical protein